MKLPAHTIKGGVPHRDGSWQPGWKGQSMKRFSIGQEVNYWSMPGVTIGSADSDHSLMGYYVRFDAKRNVYYIVCDDSSGKDTTFTLEYYGDGENVLEWIEETDSLSCKSAEEISRIVTYHLAKRGGEQ